MNTTLFSKILFTTWLLAIAITLPAQAVDIQPPFGIRPYDVGKADNFVLKDMDGEPFSFDSTRGHWVFLHFWASWCGPCKREMPAIQALADRFDDNELQIVMVNTAEDEVTIFEFLAGINVSLDSLLDKDGQVTEVWKPRGLPTSFLIDPEGNVRYQAIGGREWDKPEYQAFIRKLIETSR